MTTQNTNVTVMGQSPFRLKTTTNGIQKFENFSNEGDLLVACKKFAQTALFGGNGRGFPNVELAAWAGDKTWVWKPEDGNILQGVDGTRNWQIFRSFGVGIAQTK